MGKIKATSGKPTRKYTAKPLTEIYNFQIIEAYNALRQNIMFSLPKEGCRKIVFCSPNPSDGKTTTCVNVAIAIAMTNAKVLVIDGDFRRPKVHQCFSISNRVGLSNYLSGMIEENECIIKSDIKNLDVIPTGIIPPNPSELLGCETLNKFLTKLESRYDYILIDTPPINVVADALSLCQYVHGLILVVKQNQTTHPELKKAIESFKYASANILGVVMNDSSSKIKKYKSKYVKNYKYGYKD